ncbi:MAG: DNA alkylation repair protein [Candidatus Diapherotrites archaeon]|jgi:3-methyladenine DNA glycosylase AlkD|nr:DNA alkylation repair protein [Candidatus Diapherotrites archaeon]MBT4596588.1 DNA alkylation repair protein [Candidatus Diapherotrites archaeon]
MNAQELISELEALADKKQASILQGFFKTGKGEYGEGDVFLGIKVPIVRKTINKYSLDLKEIQALLESKIHEVRQAGLFILTKEYENAKKDGSLKKQKEIVVFYLANTKHINNWDLVDLTAPKILGDYLVDKKSERNILYELAVSEKGLPSGARCPSAPKSFGWLWERRIAIISTFAFIDECDFDDTLRLAKLFLCEEHDLMHKATGWVLREVGKKDEKPLIDFLDKHGKVMPRTMLRYAIEQLDEKVRQHYLKSTK